MAARIQVGGKQRVYTRSIKDEAGTVVDPSTVVLEVRKPYAAVTTYTYGTDSIVVKESTGNYSAELALDVAGLWKFDWLTTSPDTSDGGKFIVEPEYTDS